MLCNKTTYFLLIWFTYICIVLFTEMEKKITGNNNGKLQIWLFFHGQSNGKNVNKVIGDYNFTYQKKKIVSGNSTVPIDPMISLLKNNNYK